MKNIFVQTNFFIVRGIFFSAGTIHGVMRQNFFDEKILRRQNINYSKSCYLYNQIKKHGRDSNRDRRAQHGVALYS